MGIAAPLVAQTPSTDATLTISGIVLGANGAPLPFSTASIRETGAERFSNERGEFVLASLAPGSYHVRIKQLGFAALDTLVTLRSNAPPVSLRVVLSPVAFKLATVTVRSTRACVVADEADTESTDFQAILAELRKNADRERLLVTSYPFVYRISRTIASVDFRDFPRHGTDTLSYRSDERPRYIPGGLVRADSSISPNDQMMVIPVLEDLGDPAFLRTHCFTYVGAVRDGGVATHRIDFRPTKTLTRADVEGSVFLDTATFVIRRAVFSLTRPDQVNTALRELHVTSNYREILPGVAVIADVSSVQVLKGPSFLSRTMRMTEKQRLVDFRFLGSQPGETAHKQ